MPSNLTHVTVDLCGALAEQVEDPRLEYALVPPARLGTLLELMGVRRPELCETLGSCKLTLNGQNADQDTILADGDRVTIEPGEI